MKKSITALAICLALFSCNNSANEKSKEQTEIVTHDDHHDHESEAIELNNGEKWKVVPEMLVHIRNMENDVISFAKDEQKDYQTLAHQLETNIDLLTSNCTMTGKAHDELHKWLLPYIDLVDELSEAKNETEAEKQFQSIQSSFKTFNQYFQ